MCWSEVPNERFQYNDKQNLFGLDGGIPACPLSGYARVKCFVVLLLFVGNSAL